MKYKLYIFLFSLLLCNFCLAQDYLDSIDNTRLGYRTYFYCSNYIERQSDLIALNSIIEVNGIIHPRDTYGYIEYFNNEGVKKRVIFEHYYGVIRISKKGYDEILHLNDSAKVEIAIILQSPIKDDWGGYWDQVLVKGIFEAIQFWTSNNVSPCLYFRITSIGKKLFKIRFESQGFQTFYDSIESHKVTPRQQRRLDRKERRIYKNAKKLDFDRKIW